MKAPEDAAEPFTISLSFDTGPFPIENNPVFLYSKGELTEAAFELEEITEESAEEATGETPAEEELIKEEPVEETPAKEPAEEPAEEEPGDEE